jgi:hypothetical protein
MFDISEFVGTCIVEREIEHGGKSKKFYFKEVSGEDAETLAAAAQEGSKKGGRGFRAKVISMAVVTAEGEPAFTAEEAKKIPNWLVKALSEIALEVNGFEQKKEAQEEAKNA